MKLLIGLLRILTGGLFVFSGFVKAIDPLGTSYKMGEYFAEFGMQFMEPLALSFAVFMIVLEIVLGVALLIGYQTKLTLWIYLAMILFFTFLTGYTSVTGAVTDCGCFGDFLKLEPFQSFMKDVVLTVFILILWAGQKHIKPLFSSYISTPIILAATFLSTGYSFSNFYFGLPQFDFRPYKIGNHIPSLRVVAPEKQPVIDFVFTYENVKTKERKDFGQSDLGQVTEDWKFVERKDIIIKAGETPKINNFMVQNDDREDISEDILSNPDYSFWVIAYDLKTTHRPTFQQKLNPLALKAEASGIDFFVITATDSESFRHELQTPYPFYQADGTFLKTIIRSNPGLVLIKEGTVIGKWHHRHIPDWDTLEKLMSSR